MMRMVSRLQFDPKLAADHLRPSADGFTSAHLWWPAVAKLQAASVPINTLPSNIHAKTSTP